MARYPAMVRKRIIELYNQGMTTQQIAELFGVGKAGVRRVKQRYRQRGTLEPLPWNAGRKPQMTLETQRRIREHVAARPDATREEIKAALGLGVSLQSISRWLMKLKLPLKKSRCEPRSRTGQMSPSGEPSGTVS